LRAFIPSGCSHSLTGCDGTHRLLRAPESRLSPVLKRGRRASPSSAPIGTRVELVLLFEEVEGDNIVFLEANRSLPFQEVPDVGVHVEPKAIGFLERHANLRAGCGCPRRGFCPPRSVLGLPAGHQCAHAETEGSRGSSILGAQPHRSSSACLWRLRSSPAADILEAYAPVSASP
jgi:hypothetical protein